MTTPIIITGGHHNSALVIANELKKMGYKITWVGHRHTMIGDAHDSLEFKEVVSSGFEFINLYAGKFHRKAHPLQWFKIPLGMLQAPLVLVSKRPKLILNFGGYLSFPIALFGWLFRIPIITFEQTTSVGRANQFLANLSTHNFLAWKSSLKYFPAKKSTVVGLPIHKGLLTKSYASQFVSDKPTILVTGGKQGAHVINQTVFSVLPQLLKKYNLIHLTGFSRKTKDYEKAAAFKSNDYRPHSHLVSEDMISALKQSALVISRAGAHTVYELLVLKKPSILIPLPFSYKNEQLQNATKAKAAGIATIILQKDLTPKKLLATVASIVRQHPQSSFKLPPLDATKKVINYITSHFPK